MGDAGPQELQELARDQDALISTEHGGPNQVREVNVLVTGYGAFKSFKVNPSFLIASSLPTSLEVPIEKENASDITASAPIRPPHASPYKINIHAYPTALPVAYSAVSALVSPLIAWQKSTTRSSMEGHPSYTPQINYDYVFHIGMAAGRENYTLETLAHRDHYRIKDNDDRDGFISGEFNWKRENLPEVLDVGWNKEIVLERWEKLTAAAEEEYEAQELMETGHDIPSIQGKTHEYARRLAMLGRGSPAKVNLSRDAGRFLCEYILYTSLSTRYKEARDERTKLEEYVGNVEVARSSGAIVDRSDGLEPAKERIGKVAFLHVPNGVDHHEIARGTRVAVAAIRALVGSWEDGYRNDALYEKVAVA